MKCKISSKILFLSLTILSTAIFFPGCKPDQVVTVTPEAELAIKPVSVAFAGGGWRAHTGHSAWTIGLLKGERKLSDAFTNVNTISSNSGGSWYSTMLMYSPDFIADIEAPDAAQKWTTTGGWIGKQKTHFDNAGCNDYPEYFYLECVFDYYTHVKLKSGTLWKQVVDSLIFKDYYLPGVTLGSHRQSWATEKPLLLATTLLNNAPVLNGNDRDYVSYYQVCPKGSKPMLHHDGGSNCPGGRPKDVAAATFSSIPNGSTYTPSPFIAELLVKQDTTEINLGYTGNYDSASKQFNSVTLPLEHNEVNVMTAAAASSAAVGFAASEHVTDNFLTSYVFSEDALSFGLQGSKVRYLETSGIPIPHLNTEKVVRLADGGPADNSGVAQLVRSLQLNDQKSNIHIVAFDNVGDITFPTVGTAVGIDIASLFGHKDPFCFEYKPLGIPVVKKCIHTPELQIFEQGPLSSATPKWAYPKDISSGNQLVYTVYEFTTIDNSALGIEKGTTGYLHAFTCAYPSAPIAPVDGDSNFRTYNDMFNFIIHGLHEGSNHEGIYYLEQAMQLSHSK